MTPTARKSPYRHGARHASRASSSGHLGPAPVGSTDRHREMTRIEYAVMLHLEGGMEQREAARLTGLHPNTLVDGVAESLARLYRL